MANFTVNNSIVLRPHHGCLPLIPHACNLYKLFSENWSQSYCVAWVRVWASGRIRHKLNWSPLSTHTRIRWKRICLLLAVCQLTTLTKITNSNRWLLCARVLRVLEHCMEMENRNYTSVRLTWRKSENALFDDSGFDGAGVVHHSTLPMASECSSNEIVSSLFLTQNHTETRATAANDSH